MPPQADLGLICSVDSAYPSLSCQRTLQSEWWLNHRGRTWSRLWFCSVWCGSVTPSSPGVSPAPLATAHQFHLTLGLQQPLSQYGHIGPGWGHRVRHSQQTMANCVDVFLSSSKRLCIVYAELPSHCSIFDMFLFFGKKGACSSQTDCMAQPQLRLLKCTETVLWGDGGKYLVVQWKTAVKDKTPDLNNASLRSLCFSQQFWVARWGQASLLLTDLWKQRSSRAVGRWGGSEDWSLSTTCSRGT